MYLYLVHYLHRLKYLHCSSKTFFVAEYNAITRVSKDVTFFNSLLLHPLSLTFFSLSLPSNSLFFYFPHISSHRSSISHRLYPSSRVLRQCEDGVIYSLIKASQRKLSLYQRLELSPSRTSLSPGILTFPGNII